jgi:hypothetical protein
VVGAALAGTQAREWLRGIRLGSTHITGVISAGRFYSQGKWVFWDVHDSARAVGIEHYSKLVVEVGNPRRTGDRSTDLTLARRAKPRTGQLPACRQCRAHGVVERCARSRRTLIRQTASALPSVARG